MPPLDRRFLGPSRKRETKRRLHGVVVDRQNARVSAGIRGGGIVEAGRLRSLCDLRPAGLLRHCPCGRLGLPVGKNDGSHRSGVVDAQNILDLREIGPIGLLIFAHFPVGMATMAPVANLKLLAGGRYGEQVPVDSVGGVLRPDGACKTELLQPRGQPIDASRGGQLSGHSLTTGAETDRGGDGPRRRADRSVGHQVPRQRLACPGTWPRKGIGHVDDRVAGVKRHGAHRPRPYRSVLLRKSAGRRSGILEGGKLGIGGIRQHGADIRRTGVIRRPGMR